jgi:selenocysteine lyase/cysteine desulfurase
MQVSPSEPAARTFSPPTHPPKHRPQGFHELIRLGFRLLTPPDEIYASGIISFACDAPEDFGRTLQEKGVIVWAGDGRLRASMHIYNDEDDVKAFLAALGGLNR